MPSTAKAQCAGNSNPNLVTNPGFETGAFIGWTVAWPSTADPGVTVSTLHPHHGAYAAQVGSTAGLNSLSQPISGTFAGSVYSVCFWLANALGSTTTHGTPSLLTVRWNGQPVLTLVDPQPFGYRPFQISVRATGTDTLRFDEHQVPALFYLDDVYVQAGGTTPFVATNGPKRP